MKNYRQIFLILSFVFLSSAVPSSADTSVSVNSVTNTSNTSSNTVTGNTHIRIETNGVVKECDSKNGDCSYMQSDDGSSKVEVNNNSTATAFIAPTHTKVSTTPAPAGTNSANVIVKEKGKELKEKQLTFIQEIENFFKNLFEKLKLKF